jgi:murein DD-endopeptidase MepM/ murein hydrolase activator NlpD
MIENRKVFITFLMSVVLCLTWARTGYTSEEIFKVVSPTHLARLHTFPVHLTVKFGRGARPATFMAMLNGVDITGKFIETGNGMRALINPEDGLQIDVNKPLPYNINVLRTSVEGLQPGQYVDHETLFFVEVDSLMAVGPEGGKLQSPDGRLLLDIPPHALPASTIIALTRVDDSGKRVHGSGQAEPEAKETKPAAEPQAVSIEETETAEITVDPEPEEVEPAAELQAEAEIEPAVSVEETKTAEISEVIYQLAPDNISLDRPFTLTMKYDPADLPPGVGEKDLFLVSGEEFPEKLKNVFVDESAQTVSAAFMSFSRVVLSYYMKIGKKTADISPAAGFRLPIGDNSDPLYTCELAYQTPSAKDLGEIFPLLQRSSSADSDYPYTIFNENGGDNTWHVTTAFNRNRHIKPGSGSAGNSGFLNPADETIFSNGEDWYFTGRRNNLQRLPVHAVADGLIIYSDKGYGNAIVVQHRLPAGSILSVYSHLDEKSLCPVGSMIHKGSVIGTIGRVGGGPPYLHFEIGRQSLVREDAETGEIKVPDFWFGQWRRDEVYENYYDPTNFLLNIMGKYKWDFNVNGNDEGWIAENVKKYKNGYTYQVSDGLLSVKPRSGNLQLISYPLSLESEHFDSVFIRMRSNGLGGHGRVYFATAERPGYSEDKSMEFDVLDDDKFHEYRVYMAGNQDWQGTIVGIRLDFLDTAVGETPAMNFDSIRLGRAYLSPTPDTGQSKCYDNSREIACPPPDEPFFGQDANYAINLPNYKIKTINGDEVVIDHITGLTWQRSDDGIKRTWYEAMDYCDNLALAGYSDWRRPTWKELQSMANYGYLGPVVNPTAADFVYSAAPDDCYWSATTPSFESPSALKACLRNNLITIGDKNEQNLVRAVRGRTLEFGHFRDNGDGTVTDMTTGLMWKQTETKAMTWEEALAFSEDLDLAGFRDWRLPTIRELSWLVDDSRREPSINTAYFPGCRPSFYWSSTTHALYPGFAWHVRFDDGLVQGAQKGRRYYVRAVRGGKSQ